MSRRATTIRAEAPGDESGVRAIVEAAFGREAEATLVDEVRDLGVALLSLVAEVDGAIVGHVLFTPATVGGAAAALLGPLAVAPAHQGRGVGGALVHEGLRLLALRGVGAVVLVGSPSYYARFGFVPGSRVGVTASAHGESVMVLELRPRALAGGGLLVWHPLFDGV